MKKDGYGFHLQIKHNINNRKKYYDNKTTSITTFSRFYFSLTTRESIYIIMLGISKTNQKKKFKYYFDDIHWIED